MTFIVVILERLAEGSFEGDLSQDLTFTIVVLESLVKESFEGDLSHNLTFIVQGRPNI